jgi:glutamate N-acetyltransferase/amino-acid N-acetyltransferase
MPGCDTLPSGRKLRATAERGEIAKVLKIEEIAGSVCAAAGFQSSGVAAGIKPSGNPDVAVIVSNRPASAAAVFTRNKVCAAPVQVSREHLAAGSSRAVAVNAGNANACTGVQGLADARRMAAFTAELISTANQPVRPEEVLVASTGVIGRKMPMERLESGLRDAVAALQPNGGDATARAIMTTDTRPKQAAVRVQVGDRSFHIGGVCKGSGMIAPNMATMLAFITTDAGVPPATLTAALRSVAGATFNCVTVDGDTSTNDTLMVLANGASGVEALPGSAAHRGFVAGLEQVCTHLAKELARDGEGATKLVEIRVRGARSTAQARQAARSIANSPLVKTALFGNDPNWGRILCAAGYSGAELDPNAVALSLCGFELVRAGEPVEYDAAAASKAMQAPEISMEVDLAVGKARAAIWTCDLSYDYVRINAEYTT